MIYLDDNHVIGVLAFFVENGVGGNHVIDYVALGDLLGSELLRSRQVLAIVVTQVVVADDGGELEASGDEEVGEDGFDLGLSGLEVVSSDVDVVLQGEVDDTWDECVLGGSIDVGHSFQDTCDGEDGGGGNLRLTLLDGLEEVGGSVIDSRDDVSRDQREKRTIRIKKR
jgi:hypothetical protein